MKNNFQQLEEEIIQQYGQPPKSIFENLKQNLQTFKFLGEILELFFPTIVKLFINMSGGAPKQFVSHSEEKELNEKSLKLPYPNLSSEHPFNKTN